jgi:DNA-binding NtrC family response regulator
MNQTLFPELPVLLVDDDETFLNSIDMALKTNEITNLDRCCGGLEVMPKLNKNKYSVILLDLLMADINGQKLLPTIVDEYPQTPVIVLTGVNDDIQLAVNCMKLGAIDYLTKPIETDDLTKAIHNALKKKDINKEIILLKKGIFSSEIENSELFPNIVTKNDELNAILKEIVSIAVTPRPVLIVGESGVGKELIAKAIHRHSRRGGDYVPINSGGVDDTLFSDTLFGHVKGAFNEAVKDREGLIEKAQAGTIFLDEVGELENASQVKLLRLIQEGEYYQLGSDVPKKSNARIVTATNKDIPRSMYNGDFRKDLYFRLSTHYIYIPPLRKRKEDIPLLVEHFLEKTASELNKKKPAYPRQLIPLLKCYHFPGNIRELENMIYDAVSKHKKGILALDVFYEIMKRNSRGENHDNGTDDSELKGRKVAFGEILPTHDELEQFYFKEVMKRAVNNQKHAAELAGMKRETLRYRLKKMGLID